jgi:hypothetical protein
MKKVLNTAVINARTKIKRKIVLINVTNITSLKNVTINVINARTKIKRKIVLINVTNITSLKNVTINVISVIMMR